MACLADLAIDWEAFQRDWLLPGNSLRMPAERAWRALQALERHWPEELEQALRGGIRGPIVASALVDIGETLRLCQALEEFSQVLERARTGERSAVAELTTAGTFVALGYRPKLQAPLNGNVLDILLPDTGVYVEVAAPEDSEAARAAEELATRLACHATAVVPEGVAVDLCIDDVAQEKVDEAVQLLQAGVSTGTYGQHEVRGRVWARFSEYTVVVEPFDPLPGTSYSVVMHGQVNPASGQGKRVTVRFPSRDERIRRLVGSKLRQLSSSERNLLVLDATQPAGTGSWAETIGARVFQPELNRRLGGVAIFRAGLERENVVRRWRMVPNPYAVRALPGELIEDLHGLEDVRL